MTGILVATSGAHIELPCHWRKSTPQPQSIISRWDHKLYMGAEPWRVVWVTCPVLCSSVELQGSIRVRKPTCSSDPSPVLSQDHH